MIEKNEIEIMKSWGYREPPLLSVVCLAYNHENYIEEALDGILMQETDFPFEIVVHDDSSTDNTSYILKEYAKKYSNIIKLILQEKNTFSQGINPTRAPISKALGKYIAICEGDDYWIDSKKLQIQIDGMNKIKNCQMSFHPAIDKWEDSIKHDGITTRQSRGNKLFSVSEIILGGGGFCPTASLVFEKISIDNMPKWFDKAPFGDYVFQIFGSVKGGAYYIDKPMSVYRRNASGSYSNSMANDIVLREKRFEKMMASLDDINNHYNKKFNIEITQIESNSYLRMALVYLRHNEVTKFNQAITQSYLLANIKSKKLLLFFNLRKIPILLQKIIKINEYFATKE